MSSLESSEIPFSFLSPLSGGSVSGTFNPDVYPLVEVCQLAGGACVAGGPAASFYRDGPGGSLLVMDGSQYQANWKLGSGAVAAYRITVYATAVKDAELGSIDLPEDVVRSLNPNSNFPIKFWIGKTCDDCTETFVGQEETTVTVPGEAQIVFPADDDRPEFRLAIRRYTDGPCLPIPHPQYHGCYDFDSDLPDGYTFRDAFTVFVCLEPAGVPLNDGRLRLWKWDPEDHSTVQRLEPDHTVTFACNGFDEVAAAPPAGFRHALATTGRAIRPLVRLFGVNPAYAQGIRTVQGFGATDLSRLGWVFELAIAKVHGDNQTGAPNAALAERPTVEVTSAMTGAPVAGVPVSFKPSGLGAASPVNTLTGPDGRAATTWTLGPGYDVTFTLEAEAFNPLTGSNQQPALPLVNGQPGNQWAKYGGTGLGSSLLAVSTADVTFTATTAKYVVTFLTPLGTVGSTANVSLTPLPTIEICSVLPGPDCAILLPATPATLSGGSYQLSWNSPSNLEPGPHYRVRVRHAGALQAEVTIRAVSGKEKTKDPFTFEAGRTVPIKVTFQLGL